MRTIQISEEEIRTFSNDFELGSYVRKKFIEDKSILVNDLYEELFDVEVTTTDNPQKDWDHNTTL